MITVHQNITDTRILYKHICIFVYITYIYIYIYIYRYI